MPPHIKQRGAGGYYYLIDGDLRKSLSTSKKGLAQHRLEQYIRGEFGLGPKLTVKQYYDKWIVLRDAEEAQGLLRPSLIQSYRQHFTSRILPEFGERGLDEITVASLTEFRSKLLKGVAQEKLGARIKTVRNIIDGSFRAMWRAVRKEELSKDNPFELLEWPQRQTPKPDPYSAEECAQIIEWWKENDFFYYPWVAVLFGTGMRPSEAAALRWPDVDLEALTISITKSRDKGKDSPPKTKHSDRIIKITPGLAELIRILPSRELGLEFVFVNKLGRPMTKKWAEHNWRGCVEAVGIRYRKFYATRHSSITQAVEQNENLLAVAQYHGNSVTMIQGNYCGKLDLDRTKVAQCGEKPNENMVAGPGFEPVNDSARMRDEVRQIRTFERMQSLKSA